ncbi:MAG TPA: M23 family metallopeptidase [Anaerolineales bacterium]|nr:M23 family metallopeptidase [Anaerolineales bacterium]
MKRLGLAILGVLLAACTASQPSATPIVIERAMPVQPTASFTPLPPTPTITSTVTPQPSATATDTATIAPTSTPVVFTYVFPLQPPSVAGFADGTASHGYPATDIFAPVGTVFVAVTDGIVDFVSFTDTWDPKTDDPAVRGGLSVAIIGDDGVRYYGSHLSAIAPGIRVGLRVKAGQELGRVGNSGDARSTQAHLHFGISRPTTPDDWKARRGQVDPFPFLQAWRAGVNVTPPLPVP